MTVAAERDEEHVRRRVDGAQAAIDIKRRRRERLVKPLGDDDLERVAAHDVLSRGVDHRMVLTPRDIGLPLRTIHASRWRLYVIDCQAPLHVVDSADGLVIVLAICLRMP